MINDYITINQTALRIYLDTNLYDLDFSSLDVQKIKYIRPDGTIGEWEANKGTAPYIYYDIKTGDLDQIGVWTLWSYIESGGKIANGEPVTKRVYPEGL